MQSTQYVYTVLYIRIYPKSGIIFSHTSHDPDLICMHLSLSGFDTLVKNREGFYKCEAVKYFKSINRHFQLRPRLFLHDRGAECEIWESLKTFLFISADEIIGAVIT